MLENVCPSCQKDFKFPSALKRHINSIKSKCKLGVKRDNSIIMATREFSKMLAHSLASDITTNDTNEAIPPYIIPILPNSLDVHNDKKTRELASSHELDKNGEKKWICGRCAKNFKHIQSLNKHKKKCKIPIMEKSHDSHVKSHDFEENNDFGKKVLDEIVDFIIQKFGNCAETEKLKNMLSESSKTLQQYNSNNTTETTNNTNTTNTNNTNTNNNTSNNANINVIQHNNNSINSVIIQKIWPFGCENVDFITRKQFIKIHAGGDVNFLNRFLELLYSVEENINFTKNNMNKPIVKVINRNLEYGYLQESQLEEKLVDNIVSKYIKMIYNYKEQIERERLIKFLVMFLTIRNTLINYKDNREKRELDNTLENFIAKIFNNRELVRKMNEYLIILENNPALKKSFIAEVIAKEREEIEALNNLTMNPLDQHPDYLKLKFEYENDDMNVPKENILQIYKDCPELEQNLHYLNMEAEKIIRERQAYLYLHQIQADSSHIIAD
jgi:hypothetical protein